MVKVKGKTNGTPLDALEAASDSKQSDSAKRSSPEVEESPAPASAQATPATAPVTSINTEAIALPFTTRARLQEQLQRVERQASFAIVQHAVSFVSRHQEWAGLRLMTRAADTADF